MKEGNRAVGAANYNFVSEFKRRRWEERRKRRNDFTERKRIGYVHNITWSQYGVRCLDIIIFINIIKNKS